MVAIAATLFAVNGTVSKVILESGHHARAADGGALRRALLGLVAARRRDAAGARLRVRIGELPLLIALGIGGLALVQWSYFFAIAPARDRHRASDPVRRPDPRRALGAVRLPRACPAAHLGRTRLALAGLTLIVESGTADAQQRRRGRSRLRGDHLRGLRPARRARRPPSGPALALGVGLPLRDALLVCARTAGGTSRAAASTTTSRCSGTSASSHLPRLAADALDGRPRDDRAVRCSSSERFATSRPPAPESPGCSSPSPRCSWRGRGWASRSSPSSWRSGRHSLSRDRSGPDVTMKSRSERA